MFSGEQIGEISWYTRQTGFACLQTEPVLRVQHRPYRLCNIIRSEKFSPRKHEDIWSETDIPARRPTCLIEDQSETDILGWRPIEDINACGDPSEIDMPAELYNLCFVFILEKCKVSDQACLSPILHVSLRSCMYVSLRPNISVVSNGFPIGLR